MSIQYINIGENPNDGTGDDLRTAFLKVNDNFSLLGSIGLLGKVSQGANVGGGSGHVYVNKVDETLNFRTIAGGTGITVNEDGTTITIASSFTPPASITKVYDQNGSFYETTIPGASLKIKGAGFVTTQIVSNEMTIDGAFSVVQDDAPLLGGNLDLNGFDITGLGDISNNGSITTDVLTVGRSSGPGNYPGVATIAGTLTVNGATSLASLSATTISATTSITAPTFTATSGVFNGDLTGDTTGTHYGNVAIKGVGGNPDEVVINTALSPAIITGTHYGTFSGDLTGSIIAPGIDVNGQNIAGVGTLSLEGTNTPGNMVLTVNGVYHGGDQQLGQLPTVTQGGGGALLTMQQQAFGMSEPLRIRTTSLNSDQVLPLGGGIRFESVNTVDTNDPTYQGYTPLQPEFLLHGYMGILNYQRGAASSSAYSSFVVRTRTGETAVPENYLTDSIIARGNGRISLSRTDIFDAVISPKYDEISPGVLGTVPFDLVLKNDAADRYINFYGTYDPLTPDEGNALGGYSFPKTMGLTGQVLTAPASGNLLQWTTPAGGSGSGVDHFTSLVDGPGPFQSTDANKLVAVNSSYTGLVYTNSINATVTGSLVGNASTATALQNTRTINGFDFNGTQNITIDTRQIEELEQTASNVTVASSSGVPVTTTTLTMMEYNIPGEYNGGGKKFRVGMTVTGTNISGDVTITNINVVRDPTPQDDGVVTLTVSFTSQIVTGQTGINIVGNVENQWFNMAKARTAINVPNGLSLTYSSVTGTLNLSESVTSIADTLVKRNGSGNVYLSKAYVTTLEKNSADTAITVASPLVLSSTLNSGANNITTTGTVSAGFIALTGTGNQTIASTAQIILSPGTYLDMSGKKITNLSITAPTQNSDAATKKYVDDTTTAVHDASFQQLPIQGDTGGVLNVQRNSTLTVTGGNNIATITTGTGIQVGLKSTVSGITVSGNFPVTGNVTATQVKGGNIKIDTNAITQTVSGNDLNLVPGATGGSVVVNETDFKLVNSRLSMTGFDQMEFAANTLEQQISLVTQTTFVRTLNWVDDAAGLAYAELPNGSTGQIKMIIMSSRGTYGNALDTRPRYLVLRGNINGASRSINIASSDPNGSATFIFLNNYWWRISNVA